MMSAEEEEVVTELAVDWLKEYIRIPSVHPDPDYAPCVAFLRRLAEEIGLPVKVYGTAEKPIVIISWLGSVRELPSILLNSHMDVVPALKEAWKHDPFEAHEDDEGNIFGRGTQDMKSVGIAQLEAVRRLKNSGIKHKRTIHVSFVPDEEINSELGMKKFVNSIPFKSLNVGFMLDESVATPNDTLVVFYAERSKWELKITCTGPGGHGSVLVPSTACEKMRRIIDAFMDKRNDEEEKLMEMGGSLLKLADVTTINLTFIKGGIQNNVIPSEIVLHFDIRLSINENPTAIENWVQSVVESAGDGVVVEYLVKEPQYPATQVDGKNKYWMSVKSVLDKLDVKYVLVGCPGNTDARFVRHKKIPALGLTPFQNTPMRLHDHNEFLNEKEFLRGVEIYTLIVEQLTQLSC